MDGELNLTPLLSAIGACLALGHCVDRFVFGLPGAGFVERFGRALILGLGLTGLLSLALDQAHILVGPASLGLAMAGTALLAVIGGRWRPVLAPQSIAPTRTPVQKMATVLMCVLAAVSLALVVRSAFVRPTFQFDALTRWMFKTRVLVTEGTLRGDISVDPGLWFTHQRYPPLAPHVSALPSWAMRAFDERHEFNTEDDRLDSAVYAWFAVALVCVLFGGVARRAGMLAGSFGAAWTASLPLIAYLAWPPPGSGAFSALADVPLAAFSLAAAFAVLEALEQRRPRAWLEACLLLGCVALTKNEGLPMVIACGLGIAVAGGRSRWRPALLTVGGAAVIYAALWGVFSMSFEGLDENYWERLNASAVSSGFTRIPMIVQAFFAGMLDFRQWNVTWLAAIMLVAFGWNRRRRMAARLMITIVCAQLLAYGFAYLVTKWTSARAEFVIREEGLDDPLTVLFGLTLGRLLLHVAPIAIALAAMTAPFEAPTEKGPQEATPG